MRIAHVNMLTAGPVDSTLGYTSQGYYLGHINNYAIQTVLTGSPNGVLKVQVSCDAGSPNSPFPYSDDSVLNWVDLSGATATITTSGTVLFNLVDAGYFWARLVYTHSSGSGNITVAQINMKGV